MTGRHLEGPVASTVLVSQRGPVTAVTINRPERRNAVDGSTVGPVAP